MKSIRQNVSIDPCDRRCQRMLLPPSLLPLQRIVYPNSAVNICPFYTMCYGKEKRDRSQSFPIPEPNQKINHCVQNCRRACPGTPYALNPNLICRNFRQKFEEKNYLVSPVSLSSPCLRFFSLAPFSATVCGSNCLTGQPPGT